MTVTTPMRHRLLGAIVLDLAVMGGHVAANASVRLPVEQMIGLPSLAPLLNGIKAVVPVETSATYGLKSVGAS